MSPIYVVLIAGLLVLYAVVVAGAVAKHKYGIAIPMAAVLAVLLAAWANFLRLTFRITPTEISFAFGLTGKRFPRESLVTCEPHAITLRDYPGYGIRRGLDGAVAYSTRSGPGLRLVFEGARRDYVVAVDEPAYACKLLAGTPPG